MPHRKYSADRSAQISLVLPCDPVPLAKVSNMTVALAHPSTSAYELKPYKSLANEELRERIEAVSELGPRLLILGHHYQQDEVIALSDLRGDSYQLSQMAAEQQRLPLDRVLRRPLHGRDGRHPGQPAGEAGRARRRARHRRPARHGRRLLDGRHGRRSTRSKPPGTSWAK